MDWRHWVKGLISAIISGGANAVTVVLVAPETFNIHEGLPKLGAVIVAGSIIGCAMYLKQSPLPGEECTLK
jgi:hypothetical protein